MNIKSLFTAFLVFAFLGTSLAFTACGTEDLEAPLDRNYETFNGELKSLGSVKVNKTITHLFETDDGDILYAYSDRYDLDDDEYSSLRVEAYGVVMEYESLDKDLFEIRRITEATEKNTDDENVTNVDYKDTDLGLSFTYPDNWTLTALRDAIQLETPMPKLDEEADKSDEDDENTESNEENKNAEDLQPDYVIISSVGEVLSTTAEDSETDRAENIKTYVEANYQNFLGVTAQNSHIGKDQVLAVRYKTENGDTSYFAARGSELIELSFFHPEVEAYDKLKNNNIFAEIIASFRFLPYGDEEADENSDEDSNEDDLNTDTSDEEDTEEVKDIEEVVEEIEIEKPAEEPEIIEATDDTVTGDADDYREFESNPYNFKISYPKSWYYSGGNGGYDFDSEPIEDDATSLIRLDLNVKSSEGEYTSGSTFTITVLVGDRYYTLTGSSEYSEAMRYMAGSISVIDNE